MTPNNKREAGTGHRFRTRTRTFEDDAVIAFLDLLGTRRLYENTPLRHQANSVMDALLGQFDSTFSKHFPMPEFEDDFDVNIFADSIAICPRKRTAELTEPLVSFLLDFQRDLLVQCDLPQPSRAICAKGSFFSLRLENLSERSILHAQHTTVSLCGGASIRFAHDCLKGLPMGVYATDRIVEYLCSEWQADLVPVKPERKKDNLFFIKRKDDIVALLPPATRELLSKEPDAGLCAIMASMGSNENTQNHDLWSGLQQCHCARPSLENRDACDKWGPWILVHLGRQNEIIRSERPT